jgi:DNA-binding CsgD family transcriptional regulator
MEVVQLLASGKSYKEAAARFAIRNDLILP